MKGKKQIIQIRLLSLLDLALPRYLLVFTIGKRYKYFKSNRKQYKLSFHILFIKAGRCRCTSTTLDACRAKCSNGMYVYVFVGVCVGVCANTTLYAEDFFIHTKPGDKKIIQSLLSTLLLFFFLGAGFLSDVCSGDIIYAAACSVKICSHAEYFICGFSSHSKQKICKDF